MSNGLEAKEEGHCIKPSSEEKKRGSHLDFQSSNGLKRFKKFIYLSIMNIML